MSPQLPSEIERQSLRTCFRNQLRHMADTGGEPGLVLLVWVMSGDLPNSDLHDVYTDWLAEKDGRVRRDAQA